LPKPDITKLSGRTSARRYLKYRIQKANIVLANLHDAEGELEERFAQADQKAQDLALAKAEALERLAQVKRSQVEAEKSKVAAIHYQDPMDVENEEEIVLSQSAVGSITTMGKPSCFQKLTTEESIAIRKSHMVGGSRTAPLGKQTAPPTVPFSFPTP
jgi:predicted phage-related endonuclease